ncbi:protein of unknown function (plasmid) [Citrobacter freundii]|nr:hypothetical protein CSC12_6171 [Klebsiella michiganensis]CAD5361016.1 protein of unknown function [Citrobacter freundii]
MHANCGAPRFTDNLSVLMHYEIRMIEGTSRFPKTFSRSGV